MIRCILIVAAAVCCHTVAAQPRFQANSPLVLVPVAVTEKKGTPIDGLTAADFIVTDEGVRQDIRVDTSDMLSAPVSVVVAIGSSSLASSALAKIQRVGAMVQPLIAGERGSVAVIAFDDEIRLVQDFTSDASKVRDAFQKIHGRSGTGGRILDSVAHATEMFEARPGNHRRILILLSEARDRGSKTRLPAAIEAVARAGVIVYPATYSAYLTPWTAKPQDNPPTDGNLITGLGDLLRRGSENPSEALARASGGLRISFNTLGALEKALARVGQEIHTQYLLSFAPADTENRGFHHLEVTVPTRPDATVRARAGYWPR